MFHSGTAGLYTHQQTAGEGIYSNMTGDFAKFAQLNWKTIVIIFFQETITKLA